MQVRYTKDGSTTTAVVTSIDKTSTHPINITTKDSIELSTTIDYVFPIEDPDPLSLSLSTKDIQNVLKDLSSEDLKAVLTPKVHTKLQQEFLSCHNRMNHVSFNHMFHMDKYGLLPFRFLHL